MKATLIALFFIGALMLTATFLPVKALVTLTAAFLLWALATQQHKKIY